MSSLRRVRRARVCVVCLYASVACSPQPAVTDPIPVKGTSQTVDVEGTCRPIAIDRVDRLLVQGDRLVVQGSGSNLTLDLPPDAVGAEPSSHWALVTEAETDGGRMLTLTHDQTLEDFTLTLPKSRAPVRYGVLIQKSGTEMMALAWGESSRSYSCYLTIARRTTNVNTL